MKNEIQKSAQPVALVDLNVPQLAEAFSRLCKVEESCETVSGIVATLKGMVLHTVKAKLEHGKFLPWLSQHFPRSRKTANQYMRLSEAFGKCNPKVTIDTLQRDLTSSMKLLEENRLDMKQPVVASVAQWTKGRSAYQLLLDFEGNRGGNTYDRTNGKGSRKPEDPAALKEAWRQRCKTSVAMMEIYTKEKAWSCLTAAELDDCIHIVSETVVAMKKWRAMSQQERLAIVLKGKPE
jgi:hypothetical protein